MDGDDEGKGDFPTDDKEDIQKLCYRLGGLKQKGKSKFPKYPRVRMLTLYFNKCLLKVTVVQNAS